MVRIHLQSTEHQTNRSILTLILYSLIVTFISRKWDGDKTDYLSLSQFFSSPAMNSHSHSLMFGWLSSPRGSKHCSTVFWWIHNWPGALRIDILDVHCASAFFICRKKEKGEIIVSIYFIYFFKGCYLWTTEDLQNEPYVEIFTF